jgi:hypothetical protein
LRNGSINSNSEEIKQASNHVLMYIIRTHYCSYITINSRHS